MTAYLKKPAYFITLEGIEGAGKSTLISHIKQALLAQDKTVFCSREPGSTPLAEQIRNLLVHPGDEVLTPRAEALLMQAARIQHVELILKPARQNYDFILCDRYIDSSTVYQGIGRQLGTQVVKDLNTFAIDQLMPDLTLLLDIPVDMSMGRMKQRGKTKDRFESESIVFFERLRQGYLDLAKQDPNRFRVLDATQPIANLIDQALLHIANIAT